MLRQFKDLIFYSGIGLVVGLVVCFLFVTRDATEKKIKIALRGAVVELEATNTKEGLIENLDRLFNNDKIRSAVLGYLAHHWRIFEVTDMRLLEQLKEVCPDNLEHRELSACLNRKENRVLKELRQRAIDRKSPFQYAHIEVSIGFPNPEPKERGVFACENGQFPVGKKIEISNKDLSERIERKVTGFYTCTSDKIVKLQLNKVDGKKLFGEPLPTKKKGLAVRLN